MLPIFSIKNSSITFRRYCKRKETSRNIRAISIFLFWSRNIRLVYKLFILIILSCENDFLWDFLIYIEIKPQTKRSLLSQSFNVFFFYNYKDTWIWFYECLLCWSLCVSKQSCIKGLILVLSFQDYICFFLPMFVGRKEGSHCSSEGRRNKGVQWMSCWGEKKKIFKKGMSSLLLKNMAEKYESENMIDTGYQIDKTKKD